MAKITDFVNTEKRVALQENSYAQETAKQMADDSIGASENFVNAKLQEASNEAAKARSLDLQSVQIKAQEKFKLNQVFSNLQEVNLKTIGTLAAIDEQNRREQEAVTAASYNLAAQTQFQLDAKKAYLDIKAGAAKDGSDLMPKMQNWLNNKLAEMEANAPNPLAVAKTKKFGATALVNYLGRTIDDAEELRTNYVLDNAEATLNVAKQMVESEPTNTNVPKTLAGIRSLLEAKKLQPEVVDKAMKNYAGSLFESQITGMVGQTNFAAAKQALSSPDTLKLLNSDQIKSLYGNVIKSEKAFNTEIVQQSMATQASIAFTKGELSESAYNVLEGKAKEMFGQSVNMQVLNTLQLGNPDATVQGLNNILQTKSVLPKETLTLVEDKVLRGSNEEKKVFSTVLHAMSLNPDSFLNFDKLDKQVKAEAKLIYNRMQVMSTDDAIKSTITQMREANKTPLTELENIKLQEVLSDWTPAKIQRSADITIGWTVDLPLFGKTSIGSSVADSAPTLKADFDESYKAYYYATRDEEMATELALNDLKGRYSVSKVNGVKEIMEVAPEKIFQSDEEMNYFYNTFKTQAETWGKNAGYKIDFDNRTYTEEVNGNTVTKPFKLMPIPGVTLEQSKRKGNLTWYMVDGRIGLGNELLTVINTSSDDMINLHLDKQASVYNDLNKRNDALDKDLAERTKLLATIGK